MIVEDSREAGDSGFNAGLKVRGVAEGKKKKLNDLDNEDSGTGCCKRLWQQLFCARFRSFQARWLCFQILV